MGVFDDIKDSFSDSESSDSLDSDLGSSSDFGSADDLNDNRFDDSFSNKRSGNSQIPPDNQGLDQNAQQNPVGQNQRGRQSSSPNQGSPGNTGGNSRQRNHRNRQQGSSPNAQAGRPQEGSSEPQLSSQTRKKLDNAGLSDSSPPQSQPSQNRGGRRPQQGNSTQSVAEGQDDLEQIKSQNQQIIEMLKRINQSLNGSQGNL